jgi:hypothetical protein
MQKQINELIWALNKQQSETENTINTEINELKAKIDNIKEEGKREKGIKQKYKTQWKATPAD